MVALRKTRQCQYQYQLMKTKQYGQKVRRKRPVREAILIVTHFKLLKRFW